MKARARRKAAGDLTIVERGPETPAEDLGRVVAKGLKRRPYALPSILALDAAGTRLFADVRSQPEYYVEPAERQIVEARSTAVPAHLPEGPVLVVCLGARNAPMTTPILDALIARDGLVHFAPVDTSRAALEGAAKIATEGRKGVQVTGVLGRHQDGLREMRRLPGEARLVTWLAGGIGRLDRHAAATFLRLSASVTSPRDAVLVGIDLRKDRRAVERAYDDRAGANRRFHLNLLDRINSELGGHFDTAQFRHRARYDDASGRLDTFLVSTRSQTVAIDAIGLEVSFDRGETIETGNAYKYSPLEIDELARAASMLAVERWYDRDGRYSLNLLRLPPR